MQDKERWSKGDLLSATSPGSAERLNIRKGGRKRIIVITRWSQYVKVPIFRSLWGGQRGG